MSVVEAFPTFDKIYSYKSLMSMQTRSSASTFFKSCWLSCPDRACVTLALMGQTHQNDIERAAHLIAGADLLLVAAGAGMGVDSGLPDFRGTEGFWRAYPALRQAGLEFTSIASPAAFEAHPERAWGFYGHRLALYRAATPHRGFAILRKWGKRMALGYGVFTSNVDGQFQRSGFDEQRIEECHGSIHHLQCMTPCSFAIWPADAVVPVVDATQCLLTSTLPACPRCGGLARPNILMFGDSQWAESRTYDQAERLQALLRQAEQPVVVEIGAGSTIPSVRRFSQQVVARHNGQLIRINPSESDVPGPSHVGLPCAGLEALAAIDACLPR
jgi:NAD-dependent SIR2 family protein deacetylase